MIFEDTNESYLSNKHSNKVQLWYFLLYYDLIIFVMFFFYISRPKKIYNYPLSHGLDCLGYENFFSWQFGAWIFNIRRQKLESIVGEVIFILSTIKNILKEKKCSIQKVYIHKKTEIKSTTIFFILLITRIFQWKNNFKKKKNIMLHFMFLLQNIFMWNNVITILHVINNYTQKYLPYSSFLFNHVIIFFFIFTSLMFSFLEETKHHKITFTLYLYPRSQWSKKYFSFT